MFTENGENYPLPAEDAVKLHLRKLYYREHAYSCKTGSFTDDVDLLLGEEAALYNIKAYTTPSMFEGIAEFEDQTWHIRQDGYVWKD